MSEAEDRRRAQATEVTLEDIHQLCGASTPHFSLQIRRRIESLIAGLPADHPARIAGAREIARLERLSRSGQSVGEGSHTGEQPLPSLSER
ncbi:MAG: hypothetical protein ACYCUM_11985 [Solirubrobacteraceae bacterium]